MTSIPKPDFADSAYTPARFQEWLREKAIGYFTANPAVDCRWYRELDVYPDEARFLRAVDAGIVVVDDVGRCRLPTVNRLTGAPTEPCLFTRPATAIKNQAVEMCWREYLTQAAALADIILDYGWPPEVVAFDPEAKGAWTFDIAVFQDASAQGPWIIAVETKTARTTRELDALKTALTTWNSSRGCPIASDTSKTAKAYRGLLRTRPRYLWLVAPGRREALELSYDGECIAGQPIADIPKHPY